MPYVVTNLTNSNLSLPGVNGLAPRAAAGVDHLSQDIINAETAGLISLVPPSATAEPTVAVATSGAGTAGAGTSDVGGAFNQTTLNNNFATLTARINQLSSSVGALQALVRARLKN